MSANACSCAVQCGPARRRYRRPPSPNAPRRAAHAPSSVTRRSRTAAAGQISSFDSHEHVSHCRNAVHTRSVAVPDEQSSLEGSGGRRHGIRTGCGRTRPAPVSPRDHLVRGDEGLECDTRPQHRRAYTTSDSPSAATRPVASTRRRCSSCLNALAREEPDPEPGQASGDERGPNGCGGGYLRHRGSRPVLGKGPS